jgi:pimeloyl-ACP methyl ester carboxylesterase
MSLLLTLLIGLLLVAAALALFTAWMALRAEQAVPPCGRFIEINGMRIHYLDQGRGPAVVMVHGLGGQLQNFSHSLLERLTGEFRVILVDRPGSGYSTRPRGASAGLKAQGDTIAAFLRALNLDRPLLVGHSLGGAVALAVALDHPGCIGALGLAAPLTHPPRTVPAPFLRLALRSKALRWAAAWTLATPLSLLKGPEMLAYVFSPDTPPADFAVAGGGRLGLRPRTFYATSSDMVAVSEDLPRMAERYGTLRMPVAVLFGQDDRILSWREHGATMEEKVPNLDLTVIPGGHMLPVTAPDRTAEWVRGVALREGSCPQVTDA